MGIALSVFQQFTGINVIFYYSSVLWQAVGFTEQDALLTTVITSVTNILTTIIAIALVDRVGRKPLLLVGAAGQGVCLLIMAIIFGIAPVVNGVPQLGGTGIVAVIAANLYVVFFNGTWGPVMWVMLGEMFPNQIRGSGLAVAGFAQWTANFAIALSFPVAAKVLGLVPTYGFYAFSAFVSFFFVRAMVHETRGRELEQMTG